jgi:hypothetical protein
MVSMTVEQMIRAGFSVGSIDAQAGDRWRGRAERIAAEASRSNEGARARRPAVQDAGRPSRG